MQLEWQRVKTKTDLLLKQADTGLHCLPKSVCLKMYLKMSGVFIFPLPMADTITYLFLPHLVEQNKRCISESSSCQKRQQVQSTSDHIIILKRAQWFKDLFAYYINEITWLTHKIYADYITIYTVILFVGKTFFPQKKSMYLFTLTFESLKKPFISNKWLLKVTYWYQTMSLPA